MAMDTANKRTSAIAPASPWRGLWPVPNSGIDAGDRAQTLFLYRGLFDAAAVAALTAPVAEWIRGTSWWAIMGTTWTAITGSRGRDVKRP